MKSLLITLLFLATCMARGADGKIEQLDDCRNLPLKKIASEVRRLSASKNSEDRILAANVIAYYPAFLSSKTEVEVASKLATDQNAEVREVALGAIEALIDVSLIEPFLPLVKKMQDDPDHKVSQKAKALYGLLTVSQKQFKKNGITEEKARKHFFTNGQLPEVY